MLRGPQLLLIRQQSKDEVSVPLLLNPAVSQECRGARMDPSPTESWPLCAVSGPPPFLPTLCWPLGRGRPPSLSLSPHVPREEALSQQGRPGTMVTLQLLGPVRGERR